MSKMFYLVKPQQLKNGKKLSANWLKRKLMFLVIVDFKNDCTSVVKDMFRYVVHLTFITMLNGYACINPK